MYESIKTYAVLTLILTAFLGVLLFLYKTDFVERAEGLVTGRSGDCIPIKTRGKKKLCLEEDAGLKTDYSEALEYCRRRGKRLPTREDAWYIWISSENCRRAFASGADVWQNKVQFLTSGVRVPSVATDNYCRINSVIKFPMSAQYKQSSFWLGDGKNEKEHYAINYFSATIRSFSDKEEGLGVRCVSEP